MEIGKDLPHEWLSSGSTVRIAGLDLRPRAHPIMPGSVLSIVKGQATVFFLEQAHRKHIWLLKIFSPSRRPTDDYLSAVNDSLPGSIEFYTCTQRRLLQGNHVDLRQSEFSHPQLVRFLEGAILMPKVPGTTWASIADDLCEGTSTLPLDQRLHMCINLAQCISVLESTNCSHRDLSSTNVFFDDNGKAYLIDWDCLYHPSLPFQSNTTVGTGGYIAPFLRASTNRSDPIHSWCERSDRFALAIIIAEVLLANPDMPFSQEDGTMLSQKQIDLRESRTVVEKANKLIEISPQCHTYFMQAVHSNCFDQCPSPLEWIAALKGLMHNLFRTDHSVDNHRRTTARCADCSLVFTMPLAKFEELNQQGKSIYCRKCLGDHIQAWQQKAVSHVTDKPRVTCEHCNESLSMARGKLDHLRSKGNPILCGTCLANQMALWQSERLQSQRDSSETMCHNCFQSFSMSRDTLERLTTHGNPVYCRTCFPIFIKTH